VREPAADDDPESVRLNAAPANDTRSFVGGHLDGCGECGLVGCELSTACRDERYGRTCLRLEVYKGLSAAPLFRAFGERQQVGAGNAKEVRYRDFAFVSIRRAFEVSERSRRHAGGRYELAC